MTDPGSARTDATSTESLDAEQLGGESASPEQVGTVAEEAFKLIRALSSQALSGPASGSEAPDDESADGHDISTHVCTATWCPVCQVVGFVHDNPHALAHVSRSAAELARSLRDLLENATTPQEKP